MALLRRGFAVASGITAVVTMAAGCGASSAAPKVTAHVVAAASSSRLPAGVVARATILARYRSTRPGVTTEVKLVSLAALDRASHDELTQCRFRGCPPGALVWLVLQKGRPGTFANNMGVHAPSSEDESFAWSLGPIDASTGLPRGDSESGPLSGLQSSPWGQLRALDAAR